MVVVAATLGLPPHSEKVGSSIPAAATVQGSVRFSHISRLSFYQHLFHTLSFTRCTIVSLLLNNPTVWELCNLL